MSDLEWLAGLVGEMTAGPWRQGGVRADGSVRDDHYAREAGPAWLGSFPQAQAHADARGIAVTHNVMAALLEYVVAQESYREGGDNTLAAAARRVGAARDALIAAIRRERERAGE